jgi:hypothetical protein
LLDFWFLGSSQEFPEIIDARSIEASQSHSSIGSPQNHLTFSIFVPDSMPATRAGSLTVGSGIRPVLPDPVLSPGLWGCAMGTGVRISVF